MIYRKTPSTSPHSKLAGETKAACISGVGSFFRRSVGGSMSVIFFPLSVLAVIGGFSGTAIGQTVAPVETASAAVDYSAITKPEVAASLMLTPEQKALVSQIVSERDSTLTAAEEAARPAIVAAAGDKLQAVLTADQQRLFVSLFTGKKLRFNFRSQKWADVLDWVAKEADLSLVMETPPPGVFNYSDSKDYSTTESIDLINGWLLTKGFTLVRRERMLMCLDLKPGLPEGAIPKVTAEELPTRGRYEFVSVLFPLEGRPAEIVLLEVKPLLGTYGKAEALVQTQQLLILDTASNLQAIQQVINKVPMLSKVDGTPVLTVYPVEHGNPQQAGEVLKTIITGTVVIDIKARQISVNAVPSEQEKAKIILGQLESNQGPDMQPRLQLYPVQVSDADQMLATLKLIVPDGQYRIDPLSSKLIAWASEADQKRISESLQMIQAEQPQGGGRQLQVYELKNAEPTAIATMLAYIVPTARVTVNPATRSLVTYGTLADHEAIRALIEQLEKQTESAATEKTLKTYPTSSTVNTTLVTLMTTAVPKAQVLADTANQRLLVMATADEHLKLKKVLEQLQGSKSFRPSKALAVHTIKGVTPASVLQVLQPLVDADVQLTVDSAGQQLFVRAFPEKQDQIKTVVEQVTASLAGRAQRSTKTYMIGAPNADEAQEVLVALYPDAKIVIDADRKMIVATATDEQHATIEQIAQQMKGTALDGDAPVPTVYSLKNASATEVQTLLTSMYSRFDGVRLSVNEKTGRLIVVARKDQHDAIRPLIEQLDGSAEAEVKQELAVFRLNQLDGLAVQTALQPLLPKNAQVTADRIGRQLFVSAATEDMPAVRELVQQLISSQGTAEGLETRSYRLRPFEADEAQEVLTKLFPDATMVTDVSQEILVATATPKQHETIKQVVEQMTSVVPMENAPLAKAYPLHTADGDNAVEVFDAMFRRSDNVRVSFDSKMRTLIAVARPDQHAIIKALIEELEPAGAANESQSLEVYALGGMDGLTAVEMAEGILRSIDSAATVSSEKASKQLLVTTTTAGHKQISEAMKRFQESDPREMDVIQLRMLSASSAQNAIEGLYGDTFTKNDNYPVIQADEDSQQLLVRGTKKQLLDIRTLLIKMGETGLSATGEIAASGSNRNLRVIPIQGDVEPTLQKIQDLWPRVRKNPIRVLRPGGEAPAADPKPNSNGQFSIPDEPTKPNASADQKPGETGVSAAAVAVETAATQEANLAPVLEGANQDELSPVVIIPGTDRITIASDDIEALDQLESILRATSSSRAGGFVASRNRDFSVYQLRNAGAEDVAETLESIYSSRAGLLAFGSVVIVPEARMNALIVYGGRTDRDRIEQLLEILDTEKLPDSGRILRTQVISVKHADVQKVQTVIRGVYRTEISAGGSRRSIDIPTGIDASVANVLRQINAASSAPLLTIEVQTETNSLVVKAPQNLIDELTELITQLDEASEANRSRGVTLIPLKQTNTRRVMRILGNVLDK